MLNILGWILLGILAFLVFLLLLPVHTRVCFDGMLQVWCGLGPVSLRIFPLKKKAEQQKKKPKATKVKEAKKKKNEKVKPKKKLTLEVLCDFLRLGVQALGKLRRRIVIRNLTCHLVIADEDAAATALLYGRIAAAVSALYPVLDRNLRIHHTDISVDADFEKQKSSVLLDVKLAVCPLRLLICAVILLFQFLKIYRKIKVTDQPIEEKGGKVHEQHQ